MAVNGHDEHPDAADRRIAQLYRETAREDAPAHLDGALMAAARQALTRRPAAGRTPWWVAWRLPFALAAVAVVSVSLVTLVLDEGENRVSPGERQFEPTPQQALPAPLTRPGSETDAIAPDAERATRVQPFPSDEKALARASPSIERGAATAQSAPAAGPPAEVSERRADARFASRDTAPAREKAPPPAAATAAAEVAQLPAVSAMEPPVAAPAPQAKVEGQGRVPEDRAAGAAATARAPGVPAAKPALVLRRQEMAAAASSERPSREVERQIVELEGRPPSAWIDRIIVLRRDGKAAEADGLLAEFRRRFPEEALPPGVR